MHPLRRFPFGVVTTGGDPAPSFAITVRGDTVIADRTRS